MRKDGGSGDRRVDAVGEDVERGRRLRELRKAPQKAEQAKRGGVGRGVRTVNFPEGGEVNRVHRLERAEQPLVILLAAVVDLEPPRSQAAELVAQHDFESDRVRRG